MSVHKNFAVILCVLMIMLGFHREAAGCHGGRKMEEGFIRWEIVRQSRPVDGRLINSYTFGVCCFFYLVVGDWFVFQRAVCWFVLRSSQSQ